MARRGLSVRLRTTLAATAVVAVALALGSVLFVRLVEDALVAGVATTAERDAEAAGELLESSGSTRLPELDDALQQLWDGDELVAVSDDADDLVLPRADAPRRVTLDDEPHVVVAERVEIGDRDYELRVALPLDDALDASATVARLLAIAVPVLLAALGLVTWLVVGRALRPVETMRREVDAIGPADLDRRVAEPGVDDEVGRLARTMNRMLGRLDDAARAQRRFVSDASHELRSPLASIRQHAELARAHPEAIDSAELAGVVLDEGARLQDLVESLLLLARLDEGGTPPLREPVDLDDLVLADVRRLRDGARVELDAGGVSAARVAGDERMLARLVRNLADNAVRHARSRVALTLGEHDGWAVLAVDDDGAGIPEPERARVFERFVRLDEARARDAGGSGLGLAIVAEIARVHGGSVAAEESPLGGARVVVRMPAAP